MTLIDFMQSVSHYIGPQPAWAWPIALVVFVTLAFK